MTLTSTIVSLLLFFVVFFLIFSWLELFVVHLLGRLAREHWQKIQNILSSNGTKTHAQVHFRIALSLVLLLVAALFLTPLADILMEADVNLRALSMVLLLLMVAMYWVGSHSDHHEGVGRHIHLYIYVIFSIFIYTGIMVGANKGYAAYERTIQRSIIVPVTQSIETKIEQSFTHNLMKNFRQEVVEGGCEPFDYAEAEVRGGITHFVYVNTDKELAKPQEEQILRPVGEPPVGRQCSYEIKFMLTDEGKWYRVVEEDLTFTN